MRAKAKATTVAGHVGVMDEVLASWDARDSPWANRPTQQHQHKVTVTHSCNCHWHMQALSQGPVHPH